MQNAQDIEPLETAIIDMISAAQAVVDEWEVYKAGKGDVYGVRSEAVVYDQRETAGGRI